MAETDFSIKILADIKDAIRNVGLLSQETNKNANKIQKDFAKVNTSILNLSSAINVARAGFDLARGAFNAVSGVFDDIISSAAAFEDSLNKVRIAFNLSGIASEEAVQGFAAFAGQIQATTRFSDDAVLEVGALIQSLGQLSEEGLQRATKATLDLATSLGIDLNAAATLVGKAATGEISSFTRYGLVIRKGANAADTFANALGAIESKFGGASERAVKSFAGAVDQLGNNFDDVLKNIGLGIVQNEGFIEAINKASNALVALVPEAIKFGLVLGENIAKGFVLIQQTASRIPATIDALVDSLDELAGVVAAVATAFIAYKLAIAGLNLAAFISQTGGLSVVLSSLTFSLQATIAQAGGLGLAIKGLVISTQAWIASLFTLRGALIATGVGAIAVAVGLFVAQIVKARQETNSWGDAFRLASKRSIVFILEIIEKVLDLSNSIVQSIANIPLIGNAFKLQAKLSEFALKKLRGAIVDRKEDLEDFAQAAKDAGKDLSGISSELREKLDSKKFQKEIQTTVSTKLKVDTSELSDQQKKDRDALLGSFRDIGNASTVVTEATNKYNENLLKIRDGLDKQIISQKEANNLILQNERQFQADRIKAISSSTGAALGQFLSGSLEFKKGDEAGLVAGLAASASKGLQGAVDIVSQGLGAIADTLIPGVGGAVAQIVSVFAKGPEEAKKFFVEFVRGIPKIIENIILAIPEVVLALVDEIPLIIESFIDRVPEIIQAIIEKAPDIAVALALQMPRIAQALTIGILRNIPRIIAALINGTTTAAKNFINRIVSGAGSFISRILSGAANFVAEIVRGAGRFVNELVKKISGAFGGGIGGSIKGFALGGGIGSAVGGIKKAFGFAEGGVVPPGFPNDTFPAQLTSGEAVVPNDIVDRLESFLKGNQSNQGPQNITVNLQVGEEQLANVILGLNKRGFRLA